MWRKGAMGEGPSRLKPKTTSYFVYTCVSIRSESQSASALEVEEWRPNGHSVSDAEGMRAIKQIRFISGSYIGVTCTCTCRKIQLR